MRFRKFAITFLICVVCFGGVLIFTNQIDPLSRYKKDVDIMFEGNDIYQINKKIWYRNDIICLQWYSVKTKNVDSLYKAAIVDCDTIIEKHKKIIENSKL